MRDLYSTTGRCAGLGILTLLLAVLPGPAQEPAAAEYLGAEISLPDALRLTLEHDPDLRRAEIYAVQQGSAAREAKGFFDSSVLLFLAYERAEGELLRGQIEYEENKRLLWRTLIDEFRRIADDLERQIEAGGLPLPDCRSAIIIYQGVDICLTDFERSNAETFDEYLQLLIDQEEDPERRSELEGIRNQQLAIIRELMANIIIRLRNEADAGQQALLNLGFMPDTEKRYSITFDLRLRKRLRNGMVLAGGTIFNSVEDNYDAKQSLLANFGGKGLPNTFTSFLGFSLDVPLGKGRGARSTAAPERAARLSHRAAVLGTIHTASESLLGTLLAYWNLAAAEERLALYEQSVTREQELMEVAEDLVEGDEIPPRDLAQVRARVATSQRAAAAARQEVLAARLGLAEAIGLVIEEPAQAPRAGDPLPEMLAHEAVDRLNPGFLVREAIHHRNDVRASRKLRESSELLLAAARRDLNRRVDLSIAAGYSGLYESYTEEFYDTDGFREALTGHQTGPSVNFAITTDLPFRNRAARGHLQQAESLTRQSAIRTTDLERRIAANVVELCGSLAAAGAEVARRKEAAELYEQTLVDTFDLLRAGEVTLVDAVLTEEQWTLARLELVAAHDAYAAILARLKFEMGSLTSHREEGEEVTIEATDPYVLGLPRPTS